MSADVERRLIEAVHRQRLGSTAAELTPGSERMDAAIEACRRIAGEVDAERQRLGGLLATHGIELSEAAHAEFAQRHAIDLHLDHDEARRAAEILIDDGYRRHPDWQRGADRSFWTTGDQLTLSRTERWTTVVRIHWPVVHRLPGILRPRPGDWSMVDLPGWAWPTYSLIRPVRLVLERTGLRRRDHAALEPFLATPTSLIGPLLDLAEVGADDVIADIGCGDGRILIEAVRERRCWAIGADYSASLVAEARAAVAEAGLDERIEIVEGDGVTLPLDEISVVLLFLPMVVASRVIPEVLERLPSGARVVTHEQAPLHSALPAPTASRVLIGDDAVSVGHRWDV